MPVSADSPLLLMFAIALAGIAVGIVMTWAWLKPRGKSLALPSDWAISARPVFSVGERRLYRQLREAFPQHVVMPKLPLVRLCQPEDHGKVHYWYSLLGSTHVTFAICSPNGRVLLAIDLDSRRSRSSRSVVIKEAVLDACDIRYFSLASDGIPTIDALRLLLPPSTPTPASAAHPNAAVPAAPAPADDLPVDPAIDRSSSRTTPWRDSNVFLDSFFALNQRMAGGIDSVQTLPEADPEYPLSPSSGAHASTADDTAAGRYRSSDTGAVQGEGGQPGPSTHEPASDRAARR